MNRIALLISVTTFAAVPLATGCDSAIEHEDSAVRPDSGLADTSIADTGAARDADADARDSGRADSGMADSGVVPGAWTPPIGIPHPGFGIDESHMAYAGATYDFGAGPEPYRDAGNGPYTHYVDNSGACDDAEEYGSPASPRCSVPFDVEAGSVVEIHGGPYTANTCEGNKICLGGRGTRDRPVFVRGIEDAAFPDSPPDAPEFVSRELKIDGEYVIVENVRVFAPASGNVALRSDFQVLRHSEIYGDDTFRRAGAAVIPNNRSVVYRNHIHNIGQFNYTAGEGDYAGVSLSANTAHVWVLDNHIHHMGGDGVGTGHDSMLTTRFYYIGRNHIHDNGENAVDFKEVTDFVVSQNLFHDFVGWGTGSLGVATVCHAGRNSMPSERIWFIFNEMHSVTDRANSVTSGADQIYYVGNIIHGVAGSGGGAEAFSSWQSLRLYVVSNTIYDYDLGVEYEGTNASALATVENNIFGPRNGSGDHILLEYTDYNSRAIVRNNLFAEPRVITSACVDCTDGDPGFVDRASGDVSLGSGSAAIDGGILPGIVADFEAQFGAAFDEVASPRESLNIARDFTGALRTGTWDVGAYER